MEETASLVGQVLYGSPPRRTDKKTNNTKIRTENKTKISAKTVKKRPDKVKSGTIIEEDIQTTARNQKQKTSKKLEEPYQYMLSFPETGEPSLFESKNYKVSVSIEIIPLHMRQVIFIFDAGTDPSLIKADALDKELAEQYLPT